jgi:hypothetical protein
MKMGINIILECFNRHLDSERLKSKIKTSGHFVSYSNWERKMGTLKVAKTYINFYKNGVNIPVITAQHVASIPVGQEDVLIQECEKWALLKFIPHYYENLDNFVRGTYGT